MTLPGAKPLNLHFVQSSSASKNCPATGWLPFQPEYPTWPAGQFRQSLDVLGIKKVTPIATNASHFCCDTPVHPLKPMKLVKEWSVRSPAKPRLENAGNMGRWEKWAAHALLPSHEKPSRFLAVQTLHTLSFGTKRCLCNESQEISVWVTGASQFPGHQLVLSLRTSLLSIRSFYAWRKTRLGAKHPTGCSHSFRPAVLQTPACMPFKHRSTPLRPQNVATRMSQKTKLRSLKVEPELFFWSMSVCRTCFSLWVDKVLFKASHIRFLLGTRITHVETMVRIGAQLLCRTP